MSVCSFKQCPKPRTSTTAAVLVQLLIFSLIANGAYNNKTHIHIGALIPHLDFRDRFCFASSIKLAIEKINDSKDILPNHYIVLHLRETYGRVGYALEALYQLLYTKPTKIAILGPGFSAPAKAVAELCTVFGTLQVSYAAIDPTLMSPVFYPLFFRSTPSIQSFNTAKLSFFSRYRWKRVAVLYDYTDNLFFQTTDHLSKRMVANNFTTISISGFDDDVRSQLDKIQKLNARIIVGEFSKKGARKVFCEAYKRKMYGTKYIWMIMQGLSDTWHENANDVECNSTELLMASDGYFRVTRSNLRNDTIPTIFNKTGAEIWEEIKAIKMNDYPSVSMHDTKEFYSGATFAFDATVALAEAFHRAEQQGVVDFNTYKYKSHETMFRIGQLLLSASFEGVTGSLRYDKDTRERLGEVEVQQFRNGVYHVVARHYTATDNLVIDPEQESKMFVEIPQTRPDYFTDNIVPRDHPIIVKEPIVYSLSLVAGMWSITVLGFLLALVFLFINVKYSNVKIIKMSSPRINNAICFGCMLCYLSVFLYGLDSRLISVDFIPWTCNSITIMLAIGFTLAFGGLFSKTFRVYRVFTASKSFTRVAIKDGELFGLIGALMMIDIGIFVIWMVVSPFQLATEQLDIIVDRSRDVFTIPYIHKCKCEYQLYFFAAIYGYKGLLVIFGLFLAWETRSVNLAVLNDSKYIGMAVYNVCVLGTLGIVIETAIYDNKNHAVGYVIVALCVFLATTTTLLLIFAPKLKMLWTDNPEKHFRNQTLTSKPTLTSTTTNNILLSSPSTTSVVIRPKEGGGEGTPTDKKMTVSRFSIISTSSVHEKGNPVNISLNNKVNTSEQIKAHVSTVVNAEVYVGPQI